MNTMAERGARTARAAAEIRKCARVLTAKVASHCSAVVPVIPRPRAKPTLRTSPSRPPRARADSSTMAAQARGSATSATTIAASDPSARTSLAVSPAAAWSRSAQATDAPSLAARTAMARPLPIGGSGSGEGRVPAPTTRIFRPASRPRPGAEPVTSAGRPVPSAGRPASSAAAVMAGNLLARSPGCARRAGQGRAGARRERDGEGVQQERDEGVIPAERDQLDHPGVPEELPGLVIGLLAELAGLGELTGGGVDDPLVIGLKGRFLAAADRVDDRAGHAVLAGHAGMRPPLELGFPPGAHGDDGDLAQPALDRGAEPQLPAQRA